LYIFGTGNPTPAYTARVRGPRDAHTNLYTCSVVAVNVETGKMAWYFQTSPNDTHDWDSTQPPVLVDAMFGGKPRKMAMQASRNGYFYVLDRTNGEHLLTMKYSDAANWAAGINAKGQPERNPDKDNTIAGSLVSPDNGGATNWLPASYDPQTGLFYVVLRELYAMYYLTTTDPRVMVGLGGSEQDVVGSLGTSITAIDYQAGKLAWKYRFEGTAGGYGGATRLLTTAGGLLFANDASGRPVDQGQPWTRPPVPHRDSLWGHGRRSRSPDGAGLPTSGASWPAPSLSSCSRSLATRRRPVSRASPNPKSTVSWSPSVPRATPTLDSQYRSRPRDFSST